MLKDLEIKPILNNDFSNHEILDVGNYDSTNKTLSINVFGYVISSKNGHNVDGRTISDYLIKELNEMILMTFNWGGSINLSFAIPRKYYFKSILDGSNKPLADTIIKIN